MPDNVPLNAAKVAEFYAQIAASPPAFIQTLVTLLKIAGPLVAQIFPQYAGLIAELEAALNLFSLTADAPLQNLPEVFSFLSNLKPA